MALVVALENGHSFPENTMDCLQLGVDPGLGCKRRE